MLSPACMLLPHQLKRPALLPGAPPNHDAQSHHPPFLPRAVDLTARIRGNASFASAVRDATQKCSAAASNPGENTVKELSSDPYIVAQCQAGCVRVNEGEGRPRSIWKAVATLAGVGCYS